jgi:hypothetical protein
MTVDALEMCIVTWQRKVGIVEWINVSIAWQQRGKHMSAAVNKHTTIEDPLFPVWPLLDSAVENMYQHQWMNEQQWRSCWKQCLLCGLCWGYIMRTSWTSQSVGGQGWWLAVMSCKWALAVCGWLWGISTVSSCYLASATYRITNRRLCSSCSDL